MLIGVSKLDEQQRKIIIKKLVEKLGLSQAARAWSPRDKIGVSWYDLALVPFSCTDVGSIKSLSFYRNK
ncbi:hypothetical protein MetMK1DRAFT_00009660 [Metallosphaera yellowstonensis MK1]|uniref:Uncharacterized protein n=1 Tax=Metallosphaera yellowstonensis MK1 TaxID=671065 RepID=H2C2J3_9CREN|nr:hypothetical protein MetMK1DRAFT_00009660 [Metallosphaera yellowstonensis MK1]